MYRLFTMLCVLTSLCAEAQTPPAGYVIFKGTRVLDAQGNPASGLLCAQISANGTSAGAYSVQIGGGGTTTKPPVCANITAGAFSMFLPDTGLTSPRNACVALTASDNITGAPLLDVGYGCLQPTSAAGSSWCNSYGGVAICNLDNYTPNLTAIAPVQPGPKGDKGDSVMGPTGATGAAGTVTATGTSGGFTVPGTLNATNLGYQGVQVFGDSITEGAGATTFTSPGANGFTACSIYHPLHPATCIAGGPTAYAYKLLADYGNSGADYGNGGDASPT